MIEPMVRLSSYGRSLVWGVLMGLAGAGASGCSSHAGGELTVGACTNGGDDDGDGRADCDDPDCWVYCAAQPSLQIGDAATSPEEDATASDAAALEPGAADSSTPMTSPPEDGAGPTPPLDDDAGGPIECDCGADQICVSRQCVSAFDADYQLKVRAAMVPMRTLLGDCWDFSLCSVCECPRPDPFVVVQLNGKTVVQTAPITMTTTPAWENAPSTVVHLNPSDRLTFGAYDSDAPLDPEEMFRCSPELSAAALFSGTLSCKPTATMTIAPPSTMSYGIAVEVTRLTAE